MVAVATDSELQQAINSLLRKMHLTARHHVYAVIDEDDDAWRTTEGHYACPICGHHL
jgi:hypothetical protein